ncbi:hypothetical protein scyTo_0007533 [Scyliorhinus torazame]|uniref:Uncharacterized protein n=1 Tax=Scyliorhinus torazame TaxID=75743 RepID=A0A401NU37_SCYTO|nr:hypothetical protein [Scyliorhinus torazame]
MEKTNSPIAANSESSTEEISESDSLDSEVQLEMEPYLVRRLSFHALQLPPLAFRLAEQYDWERKSETEHIPRPTTLPLKTLPLIAITAADNSRTEIDYEGTADEDGYIQNPAHRDSWPLKVVQH